jgi:hypothetical protein
MAAGKGGGGLTSGAGSSGRHGVDGGLGISGLPFEATVCQGSDDLHDGGEWYRARAKKRRGAALAAGAPRPVRGRG